jgi:hypothetical protein
MTINIQQSLATANACELTVTLSGAMDILVGAGSIISSSNTYSLSEDVTHTCVADPTHITRVYGFLALNTASGLMELVVDELVINGSDTMYLFDSNPYKKLHRLFLIDVPAGTTDITGEDVIVLHITDGGSTPYEAEDE